ncbi:DUF4258 domain-containing protein [Thermococcus sp. LS2]|uniref:DUF4258 domain-containing protein n=1 Tax=Thermococcus sp. LS2 TaxID=1638260 RepID=UPI0014390E88|nr:DUF4258 domain-containing protein [Thermococcus sp. LS2]NJE12894.1 DUF4258 domain-containing protein [Thermococcus sp. LS2]
MDCYQLMKLIRSKNIEFIETVHFQNRLAGRNIPHEWIREVFNNPKKIVGIIQQDEVGEKFLLYYPLSDDKDLVIVIKARQAKSKLYLTLITAYLQEKRRRMKTNEK